MRFAPLLLLALCGCAVRGAPAPDYTKVLGFTVCQHEQVLSFVRTRTILNDPHGPGHIAHELMHEQQMLRHDTCADWDAYWAGHRAELEAEAFCQDVQYSVRIGMPFEDAIAKWAHWMWTTMPDLKLDHAAASALIRRYCQ